MKMPQLSISKAFLGLLLISQATAHSWVEQLMVIAPNGTFVGQPGFPRGNSPRGAGFNEAQMVHLIPPGRTEVLPTDNMCSQTQQNFEVNPVSPRLKAAAGQAVALRYQENGHVSLPQNIPGKPQNGGTIFVYGTTNPQANDALMSIHRVWNADGTGGDGRGRLLATSNYDDGQCYQINGQAISQQRQKEFSHSALPPQGADLWCQTDILLPSDLQAGQALTLYWVWDWPTMPGTPGLLQGKQEIYTSCMDIEIQPANNQQGVLNSKSFSFAQQDIGNAAVPSQLKQLGNANAIANPQMIPFQGQPATGGSQGGASSSPAPGQQTGGNRFGPPSVAPIPGPSQGQQGPNNGNANGNGNGNGSGRGGLTQTGNGSSRGGDNGTRPPGPPGPGMSTTAVSISSDTISPAVSAARTTAGTLTASPGVFAPGASPEFGTGFGTSINGPNNQQPNNGGNRRPNGRPGQQGGSDPRPSTPATVTAVNPAPIVTVTQDSQVTVTEFVTVGAGQGRPNQSESSIPFIPPTSVAPTTSESAITPSTTSTTDSSTTLATSSSTLSSNTVAAFTVDSSSIATTTADSSTASLVASSVSTSTPETSAVNTASEVSTATTSSTTADGSTTSAETSSLSTTSSTRSSTTTPESSTTSSATTTEPSTSSSSTSSTTSSSTAESSTTTSSATTSDATTTETLSTTTSSATSSSSSAEAALTTSSTTSSTSSIESTSATSSTTQSSSSIEATSTSSTPSTSSQETEITSSSASSTTTSSASLVTPIPKPGVGDDSPIVVVPVNNRARNLVRQLLAPLFPKPTPVASSSSFVTVPQANTISSAPVRSAAPEPSTAPCSKTHPIFLLRARAPLGGAGEAGDR